MTLAIDHDQSDAKRIFLAVRTQVARYVGDFLKTPLAWVLIGGILAASAWHADLREGNRRACAATSMTIDQQIFRELIAGDGLGGSPAFYRACGTMALPGPNWRRFIQ